MLLYPFLAQGSNVYIFNMFSILGPKSHSNHSVRPVTFVLYTIAKLKTWFAKIPRGEEHMAPGSWSNPHPGCVQHCGPNQGMVDN